MTQIYKGFQASILFDGSEVGWAASASVEIASGLEPYYEIGSRTPSYLISGNAEITGSVSEAWVDNTYISKLTGTGTMTYFNLYFKASGSGPYVYCYNCKFETASLDIPQDGVLTGDYDFRAKSVTTTS